MLHGTPNPGVTGSELNRLLSLLSDGADAPSPRGRPAFAERLGHWLGWSGAISLSMALNDAPTAARPGPTRDGGAEEADFQRVRAALSASLAARPHEQATSPTDFAPYRLHCRNQQQAMHDTVAALRQRLRQALSRRSPALARLAAIDAVLDQTLAARERSLLGLVPLRLQSRFERLQHAARDAEADAWLPIFLDDMQDLLQAELAHRLLPAQGLLDALRNPCPT